MKFGGPKLMGSCLASPPTFTTSTCMVLNEFQLPGIESSPNHLPVLPCREVLQDEVVDRRLLLLFVT